MLSNQRRSIEAVCSKTTVTSCVPRYQLVQRHGPAVGVIPVFTPMHPDWSSKKLVLSQTILRSASFYYLATQV
jgi:hypothetical protein